MFGDQPKKSFAPQSQEAPQGGRVLKQTDVVKKKLAPFSKKTKATAQNPLSKRPHLDTETAGEAPHPPKRVKKLAKKGAREIHFISNHTTGTTTPSASSPALVV
ncbi:hypothetical protein ACFX2H_012822 [Malus domestica]